MAIAPLTAHEQRQLRDYIPAISDRPPGMDLAAKLSALIAAENQIVTGTASVGIGVATTVVALGLAFNGKPAVANVMQVSADATLTEVVRTSWDGSGNLTIHGNANATAATVVAYVVDGR